MSEFKRLVNDPLRLKLSLTDGNTARFVRAYLYDQNGASVAPGFVDLTHQALGIYANNSVLMPNINQVVAKYKVFKDASFLNADLCYPQAIDIFEKDIFDPSSILPKGQNVFATFGAQKIAAVIEAQEIKAAIVKPAISVGVMHPEVNIEFKTNNEIEGVIND